MNVLLGRCWWMLALRGALAVIVGMLMLSLPGVTMVAIVALFAAYTLLAGGAAIFAALRHRATDERWWLVLLNGLAGVAVGAIAMFYPGLTALVFVLLLASFALTTGVLEIVLAVRLRKSIEREWMLALSGAVSVIFGAAVLIAPVAGALAFVWLLSFYAVTSGVILLAFAFRARRWQHRAPRGQRPAVAPM